MKLLEITLLFFIAYAVCLYSLISFGVKERIGLVVSAIYAIVVALLMSAVI